MKVVFIITSLPAGGAQMMVLKLLERLHPRFETRVISLTTLGDIGPRIESLGIPVEALGMKSGLSTLSVLIRLTRRLRTIRPQVVHTWLYRADFIGGLAARLAGVPCVAWTIRHGNLDVDKNKRSTLAVVWLCARLSTWVPTSVLSCSEQARRVHIRRGYNPEKIVVVPNGFDLSVFRPDEAARRTVRAELNIEPQTLLIGWIGRFHAQKNLEGFFEAAAQLHRRVPQAHFLLVGQGLVREDAEVMRAVKAGGLDSVTHLLGARRDIPQILAAIDVLASSSSGEAFSNVLGEAMSCAVPCVVTDVGDSALIVGDTGRVVQAGDMAGLAVMLENLLTLPSADRIDLGARARERVRQLFEIGNVVKQYESFYDRLGDSLDDHQSVQPAN
jgi:glycosyltransferase involved in cell wall biosynthesis